MIKYKYIDALRGLAIIAVLIVHSGQTISHKLPTIFKTIINNGAMGVQLFYVASAFTLFLSLNARAKTENSSSLNFFIRRFFRIAPMYYIGIVYYLFQSGFLRTHWSGDSIEITNWTILSNTFFIHALNPYWINSLVPGGWSIGIEMLFYCMVPSLFLYIKTLNQSITFFIFTLALNLIITFFFKNLIGISYNAFWQDYLYFFFPNQLPVFACGIILYFLITSPQEKWKLQPGVFFVLALSIFLSLATGFNLFPGHILFAIGFIALGYSLSKNQYKLLVNPITIYFGRISYSMYLVHFAVIHWMPRLNLTNILPVKNIYLFILNYGLMFICFISVTVIVSTLFYYLIEVPFQAIGKVIVQRNKKLDQILPTRF